MKKMELENLNCLLKAEVKTYIDTNMEELLIRIKTYKNLCLSVEYKLHL